MEFTTEKRRETTSSILSSNEMVDNTEKLSDNINSAYGQKVKEDKTNREIFYSLNSELTGLAYEYKYITGKYHPQLEEIEYTYLSADDSLTVFENKTYWDSYILQDAGALKENNEFHLNLSEFTTVYYPEHPLKYSRWVDDTHSEVSDFSPTEQDLFDNIRNLMLWYSSGGSSGNSEITIYGSYKEFIPGNIDLKQPYMTVGYTEYILGSGSFMSDGYNPNGDIILINSLDSNNFAFGKILSSKTEPSRILFAPFCKRGIIPENANITSTYTTNNSMYIIIINELINTLEKIYTNSKRYLDNNPNGNNVDNLPIKNNLIEILNKIEIWKNDINKNDFIVIGTLIDEIESLRLPLFISRPIYINTYLSIADELYSNRFDILDMRLSKRMGTLREIMKTAQSIGEVFRLSDEKKVQVNWFKKYFYVQKCEKDGDWKRRVFIKDENNDFQIGDVCYILTDDVNIPEIKAIIDIIVDARLEDVEKAVYNETTGEVIKEYYPVKKIFFRNAIINEEEKLRRYIPDTYKVDDGFRIIKQIE